MRASRLLSILILLQLNVRHTAESLAEQFGVSVRTIYRDIDELSAAGVPVYAERGPGGGFQLLDGYRTDLTGLSLEEAKALLMISLPGPAEALGIGIAASSAKTKLLAALPSESSRAAEHISGLFHLDLIDWYRASDPVPHLPAIARAMLDQRALAMKYESWTGVRDWRVAPLGLVMKAGNWYVAAQNLHPEHNVQLRIFKVSNILECQQLDVSFERPIDFDLAGYWAEQLARFESELRSDRAILRASPQGRKRLAALGAYAAHAVCNAELADKNGWAQLILPIEKIDQTVLMLLSIGPEVEVIDPPELRTRLREYAEAIAVKNSGQ